MNNNDKNDEFEKLEPLDGLNIAETAMAKVNAKSSKLRRFLQKILRFFHLYTASEHDQVCTIIRELYDTQIEAYKMAVTGWELKYEELSVQLEMRNADIDEIRAKLQDIKESDTDLREAVDIYRSAAERNLDYVKNVEKQISDVLRDSTAFGFPGSIPIPGSAVIRRDDVHIGDDEYNVIRARIMTLDHITTQINMEPDIGKRIGIVLDAMERQGLMNRISNALIASGAAALILAYNPNSTVYELYVEITAKNYKRGATLEVRDPHRKQNNGLLVEQIPGDTTEQDK